MSFKKQLKNNIIPRIEVLEKNEKKHLHWLIDQDAPIDFIQRAQKTHFHFVDRLKEYKEYYDKLD